MKQCGNLSSGQESLRFIPTTRAEMDQRGWKELDVLFISGDAYVDHPSFGIPLLARLLEREGYRVGIIAQPLFPGGKRQANQEQALADFRRMGTPRLFVGIGAGVVDSMLNHYTANKKPRSDDQYTPGGVAGYRPDYASVVYSKLARQAFSGVPIVCGGVEASLRRLAHYDYWQNRVRPSLLLDLDADLIAYGMAERQILAIARELKSDREKTDGVSSGQCWYSPALEKLRAERGLAYLLDRDAAQALENRLTLPSFEEVREDKKKYARAAALIEGETNPFHAKTLVQKHGAKAVVVTPPPFPMTEEELDRIYSLPFTKQPHPAHAEKIPAAEMIRCSITVNRGCIGGCSFCAIALHQGRIVQSRSEKSVLDEVARLRDVQGFKGTVSDLGGPTANTYGLGCKNPKAREACRKPSCLFPSICPNLDTDHSRQISLLRKARAVSGVRKVVISSGVRFDLALRDPRYIEELVTHHVGGHLKLAPEHADRDVLKLMRKPPFEVFEKFREEFDRVSARAKKEQFIVPYFISCFPGTTDQKMRAVNEWLREQGWKLQQVQAFIPTPMTIASAMYWTGLDPFTREPVYVPKHVGERKHQQALLQPQRSGGGYRPHLRRPGRR